MDFKLKEIVENIISKTDDYKNQLKVYQSNYQSLRESYGSLKSMIDLNPSVNEVLKMLQMKQHEKSVGMFEQLLTSLLMEVLPGYREVVLNLTVLRQAPALDVLIKKDPNNPTEDVLRGTGGSVTNVMVAGFRIISVIRSGKRKFLLLDEPDCWLKEDYFPDFSRMLSEVSEKLGVQMLLISHDKNSYFSGVIDHQVEIYKDSKGKINSKFKSLPDWGDADVLKSIRLENYQSHEDTFIPLSPTITMLRGDNDLGKSSIASAFRSVFYGEGAESDIKHFTKKSTVTVEFSKEGKYLTWERKLKGSPLEAYTMYSETHGYENPLHKTVGLTRGSVPEWLMPETGMGKIDDLDVQLTWQKEPLAFLSAGAHVRAKALAVGTEEDHVQKMMVLAKKKNLENKSLLKAKEEMIENQRRFIVPLKNSLAINTDIMRDKMNNIADISEKIESIQSVLDNIDAIDRKIKLFDMANNAPIVHFNISDLIYKKDTLSQKIKEIDFQKKQHAVLSMIDNDNLERLSHVKITSDKLEKILDVIDNESSRKDILSSITNIEKLTVSLSHQKDIADLKSNISALHKEIKVQSVLKPSLSVSKISSFYFDKDKIVQIRQFGSVWGSEYKRYLLLSGIEKLNHIENIDDKTKVKIKDVISTGVEFKKAKTESNDLIDKITKASADKVELEKVIAEKFPVCPTCHREWDHKH